MLPTRRNPTPVVVKLTPEDITRAEWLGECFRQQTDPRQRIRDDAPHLRAFGALAYAKHYGLDPHDALTARAGVSFTRPDGVRVSVHTVDSPARHLYVGDDVLAAAHEYVLAEWQPPAYEVVLLGRIGSRELLHYGERRNDGKPGQHLSRFLLDDMPQAPARKARRDD